MIDRRPRRLVRELLRLSPAQLALTTWALLLFGLAEVAVRTRPTAWSASRFGVSLRPELAVDGDGATLSPSDARKVHVVRQLSALLYGSGRGCLRQSLVLGHLLRAHRPVLRLGVRDDAATGFTAHAWLEIDGRPVEDQGDYMAFDTGLYDS